MISIVRIADITDRQHEARAKAPTVMSAQISFISCGAVAVGWSNEVRRRWAMALYDAAAHRSLATRFGQDVGVANLSYRSWALWVLGYPDAALRDNKQAVDYAREMGHATSLILALTAKSNNEVLFSGCYEAAERTVHELFQVADERGALFWRHVGTYMRGFLSDLTNTGDALPAIISGITGFNVCAMAIR